MKRLTLILTCVLATLFVVSVTGCHSNEKIYRQAYEKAKNRRDETGGIDSTVYAKIRQQARPSIVKIGNDSLPLVTQSIYLTEGQDYAQLKRYNIVVAQFKQLFNARAMRERLYAAGFVNPYIVETREPLYYVVAEACDEAHQAYGLLSRVQHNPPFTINDPFPYVIQAARYAR